VAWLAANQAEFMIDLGRFDEALAYQDEAVAAAASGSGRFRAHKLRHRALVHRLRGDVAAAERDMAESDRLGAVVEPQSAAEELLGQAWARWPDDPRGALEALASAASDPDLWDSQRVPVAHELARMALRLGTRQELEGAIKSHQDARPVDGSLSFQAQWRWIDGLAADDAGVVVEEAAVELGDLGFMLHAANAWADAAILAARAGRVSDAQARAVTMVTEMGLQPLLGPLPETRWIKASRSAPVG